jgi:phage terminase large subunit
MTAVTIDIDVDDIMNAWSHPILDDTSRYLVLYGGAGSGKSVAAAQKIIIRMLEEKGHKFLVVRKVANTLRNSVFSLLRGTVADWGLSELFKINKSDMDITCRNGNQIIFAGLDDVEKLKSIHGITGMWLEEASEMLQEDFQQLDLRLRGQTRNYKQIIISFNPISITHWLKIVFFDSKKPNSTVVHTTYRDNMFIDDEYKATLESLKEQDPYYYTVYALGEWGVLGQTVFNAQIVTERIVWLKQANRTVKRGSFVFEYVNEQIIPNSIKFIPDENGPLTIYEEPQKDHPYVIGGDIAEGGFDYSVGQVRNNITWNQAAVWRGRVDTDLYAKQMYCLGHYYNKALIGIESNFDTHPHKEMERLHYPKQYMRETIDKFTFTAQQKFGFVTSKITRPIIIASYVQLVREHIETFNDIPTLEEMLVFVRDEKGKPQAQDGMHDDLIMADAICQEVRGQQTTLMPKSQPSLKDLPKDLQEDYWKASPDMRKYLEDKWGLKTG